MITERPRPFFRSQNSLRLYLNLEEWPADVPLPPQTAIVGIGENHQTLILPYWEFILESKRTVEIFGGWFRFPIQLAEARHWYLAELSKHGWVVESESGLSPEVKFYFDFVHPAKKLKLDLSLQWYETLNQTYALITRYTSYPYIVSDPEEGLSSDQMPLPIAEIIEV